MEEQIKQVRATRLPVSYGCTTITYCPYCKEDNIGAIDHDDGCAYLIAKNLMA